MGVQMATRSFKLDDESLAILDRVGELMLCAKGNRSHALRSLLKVADVIFFAQTVNERRDNLQGLLRTIKEYRVIQSGMCGIRPPQMVPSQVQERGVA